MSRVFGRRPRGERGAVLVEMAFVAPFVVLLLLGIIEFGYKFGQFNEVRHAARDAARFAAVSAPDLDTDGDFDENDVVAAVCDALNLAGTGNVDITMALLPGATTTGQLGDSARLAITLDAGTLTNAPGIRHFLPATLSNQVTFRLEQQAQWANATFTGQC